MVGGPGDRGNGVRRAARSGEPAVPRPPFAVAADVGPQSATVIVSGDVDLATAPEVERCLQDHADARRVVVDLSAVEFLDSRGMSMLVHAARRAQESGQELVIVAPTAATVLRALDLTGLLAALPFDRPPRA